MRQQHLFYYSLFLLIGLLSACGSQETTDKEAFSQYIYGHTSGTIVSDSPIEIYLEKNVNPDVKTGETLPVKLLKISPDIKGQLILKDERTLEFTPEERFKNGEEYTFKLHLGDLMDVPQKFQYYTFKVKVVDLKASYSSGTLTTGEASDTLTYEASLITSDFMENEEIEKQVSARLSDREIPITWEHNGNTHYFKIPDIGKTESPQELQLSFGKKIVNGTETTIKIPGKNEFSVLDVRLNKNDRQSLRIDLSDNVDPDQNLEGLITIEGISDIRYKTEGNTIYLYYTLNKNLEYLDITIHEGIRGNDGKVLTETQTYTISLPSTNPAVKFIGEGVITPANGKVLVPFSAVALKAVDVQIIKVFQQNMNFFLQQNSYNGTSSLMRTARPVFRQKIDLQKEGTNIDLNRWNDFTLNLSDLIKLEKGVIYRLEIRFRRSYTTFDNNSDSGDDIDYYKKNWDDDDDGYYYDMYYYNPDYRWEDRDNPYTVSYYNSQRFIGKNIINTSLGLVAKRGADNRYFVAVNDIATAKPVSDCMITLYNYQNQKLDSVETDKNGFAYLHTEEKTFIVHARKGNDQAWLRIADANALSLSNFDVSGANVQSGLKGFIYGERGVWRPGDDIYLSFILEDKLNVLPQGHPVIAQLADPKGNITETRKSVTSECPIHTFRFSTTEDAPTGYWKAIVKIGGSNFNKTLRIETIKPNRLSINMEFPNDDIIGEGIPNKTVRVKTRWLNGAPTANLKAITEVRLNRNRTAFREYPDYAFNDIAEDFQSYAETLFDGTTDAEGNFSFNLDKIHTENAPGILTASFTTRVFENGGDFSISTYTTRYSPYTRYAGIRLPQTSDGWYPTKENVRLQGILLTPEGKKSTASSKIHIKVYKINWSWWWEADQDNSGSYINRTYNDPVFDRYTTSSGGNFACDLNIDSYGRYYIQATDVQSGHTAGMITYFGSWAENASAEMATLLTVNTDKKEYKTGEKIRINIPSSKGSVAIVSLENGTSFKDIHRIETTEGQTTFEFEATPDMCPNIYAFVTLIQPQKNRDNDRPVRLYGVVNINVEDAALHLHPEIKMPQELRPGEEFTVTVSEKNQQAMDYTLAIVDEGLLSLTSFRTPEPFPAFYAREALGVKTWDFYDFIFGAYGARLEKAFAVGGDEALKPVQDEKTNRFKPVVLFEGPISLKKGESHRHTFRMPEYIGEVRAMVVAATSNGKYGSAHTSALVNKPLMLSVAMPRLFTPGDIIEIPVTVFAMNNNIRETKVSVNTDDKIEILGDASSTLTFNQKGEKIVWFKLRIKATTGTSTLTFTAQAGNEKAYVKENVDIRVPNPRITKVEARTLKKGEKADFQADINGADPTAILEISSIPPLNLGERLEDLISYPHGCAEQITSTAFPQLSLGELTELSVAQKNTIEANVKSVINRLSSYQTSEGGFAYWPGSPYTSEWVSTYVANFLWVASQKGYTIPKQLLQKDLKFLQSMANSYKILDYYGELQQGYRLYVLALAGKPNMPAMNRMKERKLHNPTAEWLLASAYALTNHPDVAGNLIKNAARTVSPYRQTGYTFGSDVRDKAIMLQAMVYLNRQQDAWQMLEQISAVLSSQEWLSTQTTAFALVAATAYIDKFVGKLDGLNCEVTTGGHTETVKVSKTIWQQELPTNQPQINVQVKNNGESTLYTRLITASAPYEVVKERIMSGLSMSITYYNDKGNVINIADVKQGSDITAEITIRNTGVSGTYDNLALSYLLPSGFEIINDRLTGNTGAFKDADYVDIRDDRYYVYFSLGQDLTKIFKFRFNAAFAGEYTRPAIQCSAMYDNNIQAVLPGGKTIIQK